MTNKFSIERQIPWLLKKLYSTIRVKRTQFPETLINIKIQSSTPNAFSFQSLKKHPLIVFIHSEDITVINYLKVLGDFTNKALEGQFANEEFSALLVFPNFTVIIVIKLIKGYVL